MLRYTKMYVVFLEAVKKINLIFRFLNTAEIAPYVSGANYTFFVPIDNAFVKHGLEELTEEDLTTEQANRFLLNYFIKGRLYDRDLKHDEVFDSIGGAGLKMQRLPSGELLSSQQRLSTLNTHFEILDHKYCRKCDGQPGEYHRVASICVQLGYDVLH